jgi:capsular polysaccharide biosynthesis protein
MMRQLLVRFLETYYHHRWLYWLPVPIMLVVFGASLFTAKDAYITQGTIWVQKQVLLASITSSSTDSWGYSTPAQVTADEATELMQSDAFIRAIVQETDLESELSKGPSATADLFTNVRKWVWWSALGNNLIAANASHEKAAVAQQLSAGAIKTFLAWHINIDRQDSQVAQTYFSSLVDQYSKEVDTARSTLETYLQAHPDPTRGDRPSLELLQIDKLQSEIKDATDRLSKAKDDEETSRLKLTQVDQNINQQYITVDEPALPTKPEVSRKKLLLNGVIYLAAGILISILGVMGATLMDTSIRFSSEVATRLELPVLAVIPDATKSVKARKGKKGKGEAQ